MYIKNGKEQYSCVDFVGNSSSETILFYLKTQPNFLEDEIELYADNDFCMRVIKRSDYKYEKISEFGEQYVLLLSNDEEIEEKKDINEVKENKIRDLSLETSNHITDGFDLNIDGEIKHFSLETHDQQNITMIYQYLAEHEEVNGYLYHADNEDLTLYSRENMSAIMNSMLETIMNNIEHYHTLKKQVDEAITIEEVEQINY